MDLLFYKYDDGKETTIEGFFLLLSLARLPYHKRGWKAYMMHDPDTHSD